MTLPKWYYTPSDNMVCKFLKSLYGLRKDPRKWNERLSSDLFEFGFVQSVNDYSLFVRVEGEYLVMLLVNVYDIVLA